MKRINVEYFAKLREERRIKSETLETEAATVAEFYGEIKNKYKLSFSREFLKVAINEEFQDWDTVIKDNDLVVFIPPVAGG